MFDSHKILEYKSVESADTKMSNLTLYIFHQRDYYGYYLLDPQRHLVETQVYASSYVGFYDDFLKIMQELKVHAEEVREISFILDFNKLALIPEVFYKPENMAAYYRVLSPNSTNTQVRAVKCKDQKLDIVFDLNEQITPISIVSQLFGEIQVVPSSKGIIEQHQDFEQYINFSLRKGGMYHTYKKKGKLIEHEYTPVHYDADFLNTILHYVDRFQLHKSDVVLVLDGYAEMASVLEDRLLKMDFRVARVQSSEMGELPEEFSFLPMYTFYNAYLNILCE